MTMTWTVSLLLAALTNAAQVSEALKSGLTGEAFAFEATALSDCNPSNRDFGIKDDSDAIVISAPRGLTNLAVRTGDRIHVRGLIKRTSDDHVCAEFTSLMSLGSTNIPSPRNATFEEILEGHHDAHLVSVSGILRDYFTDEIDPRYVFLILNRDSKTLYAACCQTSSGYSDALDSLIGNEITLTGLCDPRPSGCRRKIGRIIYIKSIKDIQSHSPTAESPFGSPLLEDIDHIQATELTQLGRRKVIGQVLAVWQDTSFLIKTQRGKISRIGLAKGPHPKIGDTVEVVGFPETDLYRINFSRAIWKQTSVPSTPPDRPSDISINELMPSVDGNHAINAEYHGHAIRLRGTVRSLPSIGNDGRFYLESDGYTLPIDISTNPSLAEKLEIGSVIEVTGVCVLDIENWRPNLVFPHIKEVMIVTRTPEDIEVIQNPPWWTPTKFLILIGSLVMAIVAILTWNSSLRTLAHRRGKALANEELQRLEADLKVLERTRLAVELHDSVAQNLTGVSMEIDSGLRRSETLTPEATMHFTRAVRMLGSCRKELRNCLWDLRSRALEESDMNKAIRLTLNPVLEKVVLYIRFNVPRSRLTDNTAHAILRIIRELATNAIRHGHATILRIAGSIDGETLRVSVGDNGCGFNPTTALGVSQGHFGLQGIRERVASLGGTVEINSEVGHGAKVTISIKAAENEDKEKI